MGDCYSVRPDQCNVSPSCRRRGPICRVNGRHCNADRVHSHEGASIQVKMSYSSFSHGVPFEWALWPSPLDLNMGSKQMNLLPVTQDVPSCICGDPSIDISYACFNRSTVLCRIQGMLYEHDACSESDGQLLVLRQVNNSNNDTKLSGSRVRTSKPSPRWIRMRILWLSSKYKESCPSRVGAVAASPSTATT